MPQRRDNDYSVSLKVDNKTSKLVARGYISEGVILALTSLFYVPKGKYDIRMVFDATVSGLNNYLWAKKPHVTVNGQFAYYVGSGDAHGQSICWVNVL